MNDSTPQWQSQARLLKTGEKVKTALGDVLKAVPEHLGPLDLYFGTFATRMKSTILQDVSFTAYRLFDEMGYTTVYNGGCVANMHVDTLCEHLKVAPSTLYNALSELIKAKAIKKWKRGKYFLNPYCIWTFNNDRQKFACRKLWDTWDVLAVSQRVRELTEIVERGE